MNTDDFRPSTNVENAPAKPMWQRAFEWTSEMSPEMFVKMLHNPMTLYRDLLPPEPTPSASATDFGLPDTSSALVKLLANPPQPAGVTIITNPDLVPGGTGGGWVTQ